MFKPLYEYFIGFFGTITGNWLIDAIIAGAISQGLYPLVYRIVGNIKYETGVNNRCALSLLHWIIRAILFVVTVFIISLGYKGYMFFKGIS